MIVLCTLVVSRGIVICTCCSGACKELWLVSHEPSEAQIPLGKSWNWARWKARWAAPTTNHQRWSTVHWRVGQMLFKVSSPDEIIHARPAGSSGTTHDKSSASPRFADLHACFSECLRGTLKKFLSSVPYNAVRYAHSQPRSNLYSCPLSFFNLWICPRMANTIICSLTPDSPHLGTMVESTQNGQVESSRARESCGRVG